MTRRHRSDAVTAARASNWVIGIVTGILTLAALVVGRVYGMISGKDLHAHIIAWTCAAGVLIFGIIATGRLSSALGHSAQRASPALWSGVRILSSGIGYLFVAFSVLAVLEASVEKLLVGAGLAGVVLGIAAQQSLGNVFAGLVLLVARPFTVGDHIRIRSGALGGVFDAWVLEMSLTYVTLQTDDGPLKIPNSGMLAAGVGQLPPVTTAPRVQASTPPPGAPSTAGTGPSTTGAGTPGVTPAAATPGTTPAPATPGTTPAPATPGTKPAAATPGTTPAPATPGTTPATSTPGTTPGAASATGTPAAGP